MTFDMLHYCLINNTRTYLCILESNTTYFKQKCRSYEEYWSQIPTLNSCTVPLHIRKVLMHHLCIQSFNPCIRSRHRHYRCFVPPYF
uniref:Uncharacterized protein n=1 Tax=Arundo donax TaxID=35708 RepID=A0A0A9AIY8_ARUDO